MKIDWQGVYPAVTTQFNEHGQLDIPTYLRNMEAQIEAGVNGLIIGGSLGESSTLTQSERIELATAALKMVNRRIPVIVNIAEGSTSHAIRFANQIQKMGAHGLMLLPPMMYKPTEKETAEYFITVASNTDLPILVYNNPVDYQIEITLSMFEEFQKIENIQAVKDSTHDISNVSRTKNHFGDRFKILCGVDTLSMEALLMGADGWVAGLVNAFPKETVAVYRLVKAGRIEEALRIYRWFLPILELDITPQLVQNIKLAETMTGLGTEFVRLPRQPLQGNERNRVISILENGLKNRPELPDYLDIEVSSGK